MTNDYDPREALAAVGDTRRRLADRLTTPIWYYPLIGLTVAAICIALGMPSGTIERAQRLYILMGTIVVNTVVAPRLYRKKTGVWLHDAVGPRSKRLIILGAIPFAALIIAAAGNYLLHGPWIVPVALAGVALIGATVFGRHYDNVVREELRESGRQ